MSLGLGCCDHKRWSSDGLLTMVAAAPGWGMLCVGCGVYVYPRRDGFGQWVFDRGTPRTGEMWVLKSDLDLNHFSGNAVTVRGGAYERARGVFFWSSLWNQPHFAWQLVEDQYFNYRIL